MLKINLHRVFMMESLRDSDHTNLKYFLVKNK